MPEKVVSELRRLGWVLRLTGNGILPNERVVAAVIAHVPTIKGMQRDMVTDRDVLQPLRESQLQIERQHFVVARGVTLHLTADVFR